MKFFHFNPNDYGQEYFVMAANREAAITALLGQLKIDAEESVKKKNHEFTTSQEDHLEFFTNWLVKGKDSRKYTIDEYGENQVVHSEIC